MHIAGDSKSGVYGGSASARPTVSAIIPVYNRVRLVQRAIRSVLNQTFEDFELILVDDGSTDGLAEAMSSLSDPRFRLIRHAVNRGSSAARNTGISAARGHYVAFLDSDDYWLPEKLEYQLEFMTSLKRRARLSCTAFEVRAPIYPEGELRFSKALLTKQDFEVGCRVSPGSTLFAERSLFDEIGLFREDLSRLEDWDWLLRCAETSEIAVLNQVLSVVDYAAAASIRYHDVKSAVETLKQRHFQQSGLLPSRSRLRFLGTLENELAATAYRSKRPGPAAMHLFKSLCYWPYRDLAYFKRIMRVVWRPTPRPAVPDITEAGLAPPPARS